MSIECKREEIGSGIAYTEIIDKRLKTNMFMISFCEQASFETAAANAVIPMILSDSSAEYPTITKLSRHLASLYGASVRAGNIKLGDYHILTASASCIADRYTIDGENINDVLTDTFIGCVFDPNIADGVFEKNDFELKKNELTDEIDAEINDKRSYAFRKASEIIFENEPAAVPANGRRREADKLTSEEAYRRYRKILETARIEFMFIGSEISEVNKKKLFDALLSVDRKSSVECSRKLSPAKHETVCFTEKMDIAQSKTIMAFKTGYDNYPAMIVFNAIFGSTPFSKLFLNVREKMGLCYYCTSSFNDKKGTLFVDIGTAHSNTDAARAEIINQLENMKKGDFSDEDIVNAKLSCINGLKSVKDSPTALAMWYLRKILFDGLVSPEEEIQKINAVTRDRIISAAESLVLDTVYILSGKEDN